jgi:2-dehydro-3-deoxygalactonokinase
MSQNTRPADWIAAETNGRMLQAWPMRGGAPLTALCCPCGPAGVTADLLSLCSGWLAADPVPVVLSGTGAAPLSQVPCKPEDLEPAGPDQTNDRLSLYVLPGLRQKAPVSLMQAATARISGFLSLNPQWDGVICLPGGQTHWAHVSAGEVVSFQNFASLDLLGLMQDLPALSDVFDGDDRDRDAFADAVSETMSRPERLAARIAEVQADVALNACAAAVACGRLTGLLIGAELAAARPYWLGQNLAVIGEEADAALYVAALEQQGLTATVADAGRMTLAGLTAAWRRISAGAG